eukprot:6039497-Alexandrium_andersonii.AAC.1
MSASLVGSEMCIRDSPPGKQGGPGGRQPPREGPDLKNKIRGTSGQSALERFPARPGGAAAPRTRCSAR